MTLTGIEISNYRSIGDTPVVINPLCKINILVGTNNSGKSNVLRAISSFSARFGKASDYQFSPIDYHNRNASTPIRIRLYHKCEAQENPFVAVLESNEFWFDFTWLAETDKKLIDFSLASVTPSRVNKILQLFTPYKLYPDATPDIIRNTLLSYADQFFNQFIPDIPYVRFIPEFRQIVEHGENSLAGSNLVATLANYENPVIGNDADLDKFHRIEQFVCRLLHLSKAILDVSRKDPQIIISEKGLRLPLKSYGTGVHELVILVTGLLSFDNSIFCIEEPEIHLHPRLQREFLDFIRTETNNTYLISTHSPTFINYAVGQSDTQIIHLRNNDGGTVSSVITQDAHALAALRDLGARASDLLQANGIIWVEGPSDRIYMKRWLELLYPDKFEEGRDYSIMFYGGKLLSHLSFERDLDLEDFIRLLRINQNAIVVMDSDRKSRSAPINATKQRILTECEGKGILCWVTDGREIENYLGGTIISAYLSDISKRDLRVFTRPYHKWDVMLKRAANAAGIKIDYARHKVDIAKEIIKGMDTSHMGDSLKRKMEQVAERIKTWNE